MSYILLSICQVADIFFTVGESILMVEVVFLCIWNFWKFKNFLIGSLDELGNFKQKNFPFQNANFFYISQQWTQYQVQVGQGQPMSEGNPYRFDNRPHHQSLLIQQYTYQHPNYKMTIKKQSNLCHILTTIYLGLYYVL